MFCSRCGTWAPDGTALCKLCGLVLLTDFSGPRPPEPGLSHAAAPAAPRVPEAPAASYSGFWRRLMALLLDSVLLFFPAAIVRVLLGQPVIQDPMESGSGSPLATGIELAIDATYAVAMVTSRARATLGMQAMEIQLVTVNGERVGVARATLRWFAQLLDILTLGIGYLIMFFNRRRQTLHDLVSGTVVVHQPETAPEPMPMRVAS